MFKVVSTYRPRTASKLTDEELVELRDALASLDAGQAVIVSREERDTPSKARTDGLAIRTQYAAAYGVDLRTHVLGEDGANVGAVSLPLVKPEPNGDEPTGDDKPRRRRKSSDTPEDPPAPE